MNEVKLIDLAEAERQPRLKSISMDQFLAMKIPLREMVLAPIIPTQGLVMVFAERGIGKTHVALSIAYAVASGGAVFKWSAPVPRRVLYIDGEMPAATMQERLLAIDAASATKPPEPDFLRIITPDVQDRPIPDMSSAEGQAAIEEHLVQGCDLLILDNLSTLCRAGRENESESWIPVQEWLLSLRKRGISVLMIHHAGKGGKQRGTSKREDVLDTSIKLLRPGSYNPTEGARFEVHLEKARGISGEDAMPFEAKLEIRDGEAAWSCRPIEDPTIPTIVAMTTQGMSTRDISVATGIPKTNVNRIQAKARNDGLLGS
jgi:putative DNA primase/helicase